MSFFGTNPLTTQVGQLIERATDPSTPDENVELIYEICDVINAKEENAKDALKAIRKKLSIYAGRNWSVVMKLLNLIDLCVSNCNKRFHLQICNKDFLQELKNMIGPKLQPPIIVQEKVLSLIQKWANVFKNDTELRGVETFYNDLRSKGVDFPVAEEARNPLDPSTIRPTLTSETSNNTTSTTNITTQQQQAPKPSTMIRSNANSQGGAAAAAALPTMVSLTTPQDSRQIASVPTAITLTSEQIAKLNSELDIVECNVQVFNDVINELSQAQTRNGHLNEYNAEIELLRELSRTCKDMQGRITQLVASITNESLINELLRVNDDLNNVFLRHERFERGLPPNQNTSLAASNNTPSQRVSNIYSTIDPAVVRNNKKTEEKPLIDFEDDVTTNTNKLASIHLTSTGVQDASDPSMAFLQDENEIKEIESWLKNQGSLGDIRDRDNRDSEFDEFLSQRMNASGTSQTSPKRGGDNATAATSNNRHVKTDTKSKFEL